MASKFFGREGFRYFAEAATELKSWKELEQAAQPRVEGTRTDMDALKMLITAKQHLGANASAVELSKKLTSDNMAGSQERNFAAWLRILGGSADEALLTELSGSGPHASSAYQDTDTLYTLAMLQTQLKKIDDAQQSMKRAMETQNFDELDARAWVVYGKICEFYGFVDEAKTAWERARSATNDNDVARWSLMAIDTGGKNR
jgi:tetratricopeptide (TPR) repeat protein